MILPPPKSTLFPSPPLSRSATSKTSEHDQPATRWSLDDLAATIVNEAHHRAMSRATIWRILDEADLKPHKSVYWLNSHDPEDRKSTRLNSSHSQISYAVFCL